MPPIVTRTQPGHHRSREAPAGFSGLSVGVPRMGMVDPKALGPVDTIRTYPSLLQYYSADQQRDVRTGALVTADQTATPFVTDLSGNGNHLASLCGGNNVLWRNGANGIGGIPAWSFGGGVGMNAGGRVLPLAGFTLFAVLTYSGGRLIGLENSGSGTHGLGMLQSSGLWIIRNNGSTWDVSFSGTSPEVLSLAVGSGGGRASVNGTITTNASAVSFSDASVVFTLGGSGEHAAGFNGKVAMFASYAVKMNSTDQDAVVTYLRGKYGI